MSDSQDSTGKGFDAEKKAKDRLGERLLSIGRECAPLFKEPYRSVEHGDLLYGEDGLPQ